MVYPSSDSGGTRTKAAVKGQASGSFEVGIFEQIATMSVPFFDMSSLFPRLEQMERVATVFFENPIFGIGAANWKYTSIAEMRIHNAYMTLLVETGILGLVLYLGAVVAALGVAVRLLVMTETDRLVYLGAVAGVVGFFVSIIFHPYDKYTLLIPPWVVLGALVGQLQSESGY